MRRHPSFAACPTLRPLPRVPLLALAFIFPALGCSSEPAISETEATYQGLVAEYLQAWTDFYPSDAVALGLHEHLAKAEDRGAEVVEGWVAFNRQVMDSLDAPPPDISVQLRMDLRLLEDRVQRELRSWGDAALMESPELYAQAIRNLLNLPEDPRGYTPGELEAAVASRMEAVAGVAADLRTQLRSGRRQEVARTVRSLQDGERRLAELVRRWPSLEDMARVATRELAASTAYLEEELETREESGDQILGRDRYARELALYYGMPLSPEEVAERAMEEMETVRSLIAQVSEAYWEEAYPGKEAPGTVQELVTRVSTDMEENRSSSEAEALETFTRFALEAETFVKEKGIATLPSDRTLEIRLTPESAGPLQRIGFVDSAPPFDPDPMTVLSIPTIPDTFPAQEKENFYRSFNNHFNKFIIIHELFPGHYMQLKIASQNPRQIRSFFPYEPYIEGWATLVETFALEAGWDDYNELTYLAHLRKRLENANRAYTSVQVHCFGWNEDRVREFSREEALLAPQFAESLWGRLLRSPMQMTSYFMGKEMFRDVLEAEKARLGEDFQLRRFNDVILRAGAVPLDMIPELLAESEKEPNG
mgnify:FL=1